jgi:hypothetical protein
MPGEPHRGTEVEILLTSGGALLTIRRSWQRTRGGDSTLAQFAKAHTTPMDAYNWLVEDGDGWLGPASKQAWTESCRNVPALAGYEFERID